MKPSRIVLGFVISLFLSACATTGETASRRPDAGESGMDYVTTVESVARRRGIHVQWINPPSRRTVSLED